MVSRERLLRLGATLAEHANRFRERRIARVVGRLLVAGLVIVLALRLWQLWRRDPVDFGALDIGLFAVAVVISALAIGAYGLVWLYLLRRLGAAAPLSWMGLFFKSQLGKYLPGSVWQYAGRVGLARSRGVPVQIGLASVISEVAYSAIAAALASSLVLGSVAISGVLLGIAGLLVLAITFRPFIVALLAKVPFAGQEAKLERAGLFVALRSGPAAIALYLVVWCVYGVAFWTTGRALFGVPVSDLPQYVGVFALAWLAGLVAFFAPGGIGVREAVIAALLSSRLGQADAIVLAATSRIILTAIDLVAGAAAIGLPTLRRSDRRPLGADR
jgi:glycosyltransferase 2 family protein